MEKTMKTKQMLKKYNYIANSRASLCSTSARMALALSVCILALWTKPGFSQDMAEFDGPGNEIATEEMRQHFRKRMKARQQNKRGGRGGPAANRMKRLSGFLGFMEKYIDNVQDPRKAAGIALFALKEHYARAGKPDEAIKEFQSILQRTKDPKMRNIILFTLRQVYEQKKDREKLLALNRQILEENLAAIE